MPKIISLWSVLLLIAGVSSAAPEVKVTPSPVQVRISVAQARLKAGPPAAGLYNDLAVALCREGRDTEDVSVFDQAQDALQQSLRLAPGNYEAQKLQVTVLLGRHDFQSALKLASELNHKVPDDIAVWAALVDTNIALGNYAEAERQAQWVLDLRPGNTLGFEKAAALRVMFGDITGAIEFIDEANRRTAVEDADQHAWLLTRKANLELASGLDSEAETLLQQAFQLFPDSQLATAGLANVRVAQGKFTDAAALLEKRYQRVKSARNLYDWAESLEAAGQKVDASAAFAQFERQANAESPKPFNANLQLVFFDLNEKHDPAAALVLAGTLSKARHDCGTLDAYAWALYANAKYAEAQTQIQHALAVGVREPVYFCHASQIAAKTGDRTAAASYQKELASFKGGSCAGEKTQIVSAQVSKP